MHAAFRSGRAEAAQSARAKSGQTSINQCPKKVISRRRAASGLLVARVQATFDAGDFVLEEVPTPRNA